MAAPYISDLDPTTPLNTDSAGNGNEELQNIKLALQNTWPSIDGEVTVTQDELNTFEDRIDALEATPGYSPPVGSIMMWAGGAGPAFNTPIPAGWAYCNGQVANGIQTPDMRARFVLDGGAFGWGLTGGGDPGETDTAGQHGHTITVSDTALTAAQLPDISSNIQTRVAPTTQSDDHSYPDTLAKGSTTGAQTRSTDLEITGLNGDTHTHTGAATLAGNHTHTFNAPSPVFYTVYYIMFVGVAP
jgi:hypothetical protein